MFPFDNCYSDEYATIKPTKRRNVFGFYVFLLLVGRGEERRREDVEPEIYNGHLKAMRRVHCTVVYFVGSLGLLRLNRQI